MPIPANVGKIVVRGNLNGGERFACSLWFNLPPEGNRETAQVAAQHLADGTTALFGPVLTAAANLLNTQSSITAVDVYYYTGGQQASDKGTAAAVKPGNGSATIYPNQACLVTTLRSANLTRSGRGRAYWPANGQPLGNDGLYTAAGPQALINALNAFMVQGTGVVVSKTRGVAQRVTKVDCDRVPDTQRSRVKSLVSSRLNPA